MKSADAHRDTICALGSPSTVPPVPTTYTVLLVASVLVTPTRVPAVTGTVMVTGPAAALTWT
jgi:hypothetical protein